MTVPPQGVDLAPRCSPRPDIVFNDRDCGQREVGADELGRGKLAEIDEGIIHEVELLRATPLACGWRLMIPNEHDLIASIGGLNKLIADDIRRPPDGII